MTRIRRWTVRFVLCFLLVAAKASATYVVIENISQTAPNWGGCNCIQATGWLAGITMAFSVVDKDGTTYQLRLQNSDSLTKHQAKSTGNYFMLDITKTNPIAPGGIYISKKIGGLPDAGFWFLPREVTFIGMYYCEACQDSCGGYSTGSTDAGTSLFIIPGLTGSDSVEFQVPLADFNYVSVVRVTFYPGNPPTPGQTR